jgi:hypothetical protein
MQPMDNAITQSPEDNVRPHLPWIDGQRAI